MSRVSTIGFSLTNFARGQRFRATRLYARRDSILGMQAFGKKQKINKYIQI